MNLNKTDVIALKALANNPQKTRDLAVNLRLNRSRASVILNKLVKTGLAEKEGRTYKLAQTQQATAIRMLLRRQPSLALENILQETEFKVLKSLSEGQKTPKEIAEEIQKTARTVYLKLAVFKSMGLAVELGAGTYAINKDSRTYQNLKPLLEDKIIIPPFAMEESDGWTAWSGEDEYILKTNNPEKLKKKIQEKGLKWKYTSTSALDHHGIHLIPPETTFYAYRGDKLKNETGNHTPLEDVIIHLLQDETEKAIEYAKWLLLLHKDKTDLIYLKKTSKKHKLSKEIEGILYDLKPIIQD